MIEVAVCEDSEIDRGMLEEIIGFLMTDRGLEYNMTPFSNGEGLVAGYKNHPFDLIFLDVMMNEIDGIEIRKADTARWIKMLRLYIALQAVILR